VRAGRDAMTAALKGRVEDDDTSADYADRHQRQIRNDPPAGALKWRDAQERKQLLGLWRTAVLKTTHNASQVKLAWLLHGRFGLKEGYAYMGDGFLTREMACSRKTIQAAHAAMESEGAIIRTQVNGKRRIYPAKAIVETVLGCHLRGDTSDVTCSVTPLCVTYGVTHNKKRHGLSAFNAAKQAKQLREGTKMSAREMSDALSNGTPRPYIPFDSPAEPPPKRRPVKEPEFVPDATLRATGGAPTAIGDVPATGIPFMVTKNMKAELGGLGYTVEQISNMTPAPAHEILADAADTPRRPPRPEHGNPGHRPLAGSRLAYGPPPSREVRQNNGSGLSAGTAVEQEMRSRPPCPTRGHAPGSALAFGHLNDPSGVSPNRYVPPDHRPALGPPGDSLDDLKW